MESSELLHKEYNIESMYHIALSPVHFIFIIYLFQEYLTL
jgi:hypothetical protein